MTTHPAAWHPDPSRRHEQRYWDGAEWSEHVSTNGVQALDAHGRDMANKGEVQASEGIIDGEFFRAPTQESIQNQVTRAEAGEKTIPDAITQLPEPTSTPTQASTSSSIFDQKVLVVNQKAKLMELTSEFRIFDENGIQIGAVREVGQSAAKKVLRAVTNLDSMMTHTMEIVDMNGDVQLKIIKPRALLKPKVIVEDANGQVLGELAIKLRIGKAQIRMLIDGNLVGMILAENFRAWNFKIVDASDNQIAHITKTWEGFTKAIFTTADNYVVQIDQPLVNPLHSLVLASSLAVDLILKQNDKGLI